MRFKLSTLDMAGPFSNADAGPRVYVVARTASS